MILIQGLKIKSILSSSSFPAALPNALPFSHCSSYPKKSILKQHGKVTHHQDGVLCFRKCKKQHCQNSWLKTGFPGLFLTSLLHTDYWYFQQIIFTVDSQRPGTGISISSWKHSLLLLVFFCAGHTHSGCILYSFLEISFNCLEVGTRSAFI